MAEVKKPSLAEELDNLLNVAPKPFESDEEDERTKAKVVDKFEEPHSDDEQVSSFRKKNVPLLDEIDDRYKGKKVTRKEAFGEESDEDEDDVEMESDEADEEEEEEEDEDGDEVEENNEDDESDDDDDDDDENEKDEENPLYRDRSENAFKNLVSSNEAEAEKGNCVKIQQKIWEKVLEMRIKLQPVLITSNKMPQYDVVKNLQTTPQFNKQKKETLNKLSDVLDNLLSLQQNLLKNFPETKNLLDKKADDNKNNDNADDDDDDDEEICSDTEEENEKSDEEEEEEEEENSEEPPKKKTKRSLKDYEKIISDIHNKYTPYRNSVIQKWNDKTRVASGKINKDTNQSVVKQIEFLLNDKPKLIKRTQLKRSEYEIVGKKSLDETDENGRRVEEYDTEIYDDDDFYHQLLRELIEQKTCHITDPVELSRQFSKLQSMRNKLKRKIDTRATKGRRIRYNVHPNLVNFMPSISVNDTWSDSAKNALYNSLFGKRKAPEV